MHDDETDPAGDGLDWSDDSGPDLWHVFAVVVGVFAFIALLALGASRVDAADPVDVALADLKADKAVRAALTGTPAAGRGGRDVSAPPPVVIVPGRWVQGPDGFWRFQPSAAEVAAPPSFRGPPLAPSAGPRSHAGHDCPACGTSQFVVSGRGPGGTHTHTCPRCSTKWFH